jgi:hypothetical protein
MISAKRYEGSEEERLTYFRRPSLSGRKYMATALERNAHVPQTAVNARTVVGFMPRDL